jgi:HlyD family secretion protein
VQQRPRDPLPLAGDQIAGDDQPQSHPAPESGVETRGTQILPPYTHKQWSPDSIRHHEGQSSDQIQKAHHSATLDRRNLTAIGQAYVGRPSMAPDRYDLLPSLQPDEFLPPIGRWMVLGGIALVTALTLTVILANVLEYTVTIKAPAVVRPHGELRLVQTAIAGTVKRILVHEDQRVTLGQPIALIDDSRLQTTKQELRERIEHAVPQLKQVDAQLHAIDEQVTAETNRISGAVLAAQATLARSRRQYQDRKTVTNALMQEARAAFDLAQDALTRYRKLAESGVIPKIVLKEKEAALETARAKLRSAQAAIDPSGAEVEIAREAISQERALGQVTLTRLHQDGEELKQKRLAIQSQIVSDRQELRQTEQELTFTTIRAPASGTIQTLNLRNTSQVVQTGENIALIAPGDAALLIKAFVPSQDIDKVKLGQPTKMRVSACPYPDYGTLDGNISAISPDSTTPSGNGTDLLPKIGSGATYEITVQPKRLFLTAHTHRCFLQSGMEGLIDIIARKEKIMTFVLRKARLLTDL